MKTPILLFDNSPIFRQGVKLILENNGSYEVVGEASDEIQLVNILSKIEPKIILINLMLGQNQVLSITKKLKNNFPDIPFLCMANGAEEDFIVECINNGAKNIIRKENTPEQLLEAINKAVNGGNYLNIPEYQQNKRTAEVEKKFTPYYKLKPNTNTNGSSVLSNREIEVVKLFAEGKSYKAIANELHISPRTVESHKKNILAKLNLDSIVDLAKFALKQKLIES